MSARPMVIQRPIVEVEPKPSAYNCLYISSGDGEERAGCRLTVAALRWYVTIRLPGVIRPERKKVFPESWDAATIARLGRNWYWDYTERRYGFSFGDNHLSVYYGRATDDSSTEQRFGCFLPWGEWRHVRHSLYGLSGEHCWTEWTRDRKRGLGVCGFDAQRAAEEQVPKFSFKFADFDGEIIKATTHIEEREWHRGAGWFRWLSWFYAPKIRRSLSIAFDKETGPRKGSWKGGTVGHSIDMLDGELHMDAFKRYCAQNKMVMQ